MKRLLLGCGGLLGLVALLLLLAFLFLPSTWTVERAIDIQAPTTEIHRDVADLRKWRAWSYWNRKNDPECIWEYGGAELGKGSLATWRGPTYGHAELQVVASDPATGVDYEAVFQDGALAATGAFRYEVTGDVTRVVWTTSGELAGFQQRLLRSNFVDTLGIQLDESLRGLKKRVDTRLHPPE